jgi:hypothetical protein
MSFDSRLLHTLVIERATPGPEDDYGHASRTYSALATVPGLVQPKAYREVALTSQGGAVISTHTIFMRPTDLQEADRILYGGHLYEITGVRDAAGLGHHYEVDAKLIGGPEIVVTPPPAALVLHAFAPAVH